MNERIKIDFTNIILVNLNTYSEEKSFHLIYIFLQSILMIFTTILVHKIQAATPLKASISVQRLLRTFGLGRKTHIVLLLYKDNLYNIIEETIFYLVVVTIPVFIPAF